MRILSLVLLLALLTFAMFSLEASEVSAILPQLSIPARCSAVHNVGNLVLHTTNGGVWGSRGGWSPYSLDSGTCTLDNTTLMQTLLSDEYPKGSFDHFLDFGSLWIGAITELDDTLVTNGYDCARIDIEFAAEPLAVGEIAQQSLAGEYRGWGARSDQDFVSVFTDTVTRGVPVYKENEYLTRPVHRPLGLEITQTSMQWSNPLVDDFVITEFRVKNIGLRDLSNVYVGFCMIPAVGHTSLDPGYTDTLQGRAVEGDDVCGYLRTTSFFNGGCRYKDTLNMAWAADADGDPTQELTWAESGSQKSIRGVAGLRFLESPPGTSVSFNWWTVHEYHPRTHNQWAIHDFGPRRKPPAGQQARNFGTGGNGDPLGVANMYYVMSSGEIDYDHVYTGNFGPNDPIWEFPTEHTREYRIWRGEYMAYLLAVGPFDLEREWEETIVTAYVAAPDFHTDPTNMHLLSEQRLEEWYSNLDFSGLAKHAKMAEWVYDNPGYDTDGDGYAGKSHICVSDSVFTDGRWIPTVAETTFYTGDGVADWRAPGAPPAPKFWLYPYDHGIRVRFNGSQTETAKDLVTNRVDFEGYRLYFGRDEREGSFVLSAGYDLHNYDKYVWNPNKYPHGAYDVQEIPLSLEQVRCLYGRGEHPCEDSLFDPLGFTQDNPYRLPGFVSDSAFYFVQHGYNASRLGIDTPIRKLYPNLLKPIPGEPIPDSAYTEDGYLKYYEYECIIDGLLPTVPYYVNVTAIDYGDPAGGVEALESSKLLGLQDCYALENANQTSAINKPVYIYPNPYRVDAKYREMGYEGRGSDRINDRERRIHFANLPAKCWIRIHTLDGDMVREIRHDMDPNDPASDHDTWDLINRNIMAVESGLYYWSVEPDSGPVQIGKLVIIR